MWIVAATPEQQLTFQTSSAYGATMEMATSKEEATIEWSVFSLMWNQYVRPVNTFSVSTKWSAGRIGRSWCWLNYLWAMVAPTEVMDHASNRIDIISCIDPGNGASGRESRAWIDMRWGFHEAVCKWRMNGDLKKVGPSRIRSNNKYVHK